MMFIAIMMVVIGLVGAIDAIATKIKRKKYDRHENDDDDQFVC